MDHDVGSFEMLSIYKSLVRAPFDFRSAKGVFTPHQPYDLMPLLHQRAHQRLANETMRTTHKDFHFVLRIPPARDSA
jgi:hypothetical protein